VVYGLDRPLRVRGRVGVTIDLDGGWLTGTPDDGFEGALRRGRFYTQGKLDAWYGPAYKFQFGVEHGDVFLNDFYLRWELPVRFVDRLQVGYFEQPTGLSALASSGSRPMMELAAPVAAFRPGHRLGVQIEGAAEAPDLTWQLSVSSVGQSSQNAADASDSTLRGILRIAWRPWHEEEGEADLLHLGMSAGYTLSGSGDLRYRARPETFLGDPLVDTGDVSGDAALLAWEAAWRRGAFTLQSELFLSLAHAGGSAQLAGVAVEASRVLSGETRPYFRSSAEFGRVQPDRPLSLRGHRWGAFQLTGRLGWLDLDDGPVRGGRMLTTNLELVWTWNAYVRIHAGGVYAHAIRAGDTTDALILQSRLELRF
jgi:phosphate-selective porin OprO/OprP